MSLRKSVIEDWLKRLGDNQPLTHRERKELSSLLNADESIEVEARISELEADYQHLLPEGPVAKKSGAATRLEQGWYDVMVHNPQRKHWIGNFQKQIGKIQMKIDNNLEDIEDSLARTRKALAELPDEDRRFFAFNEDEEFPTPCRDVWLLKLPDGPHPERQAYMEVLSKQMDQLPPKGTDEP